MRMIRSRNRGLGSGSILHSSWYGPLTMLGSRWGNYPWSNSKPDYLEEWATVQKTRPKRRRKKIVQGVKQEEPVYELMEV